MLDYDGTLAPIAPHPDLATLPLETKHTLQRLSNMSDVYIAIISGRNVDNVKNMVRFVINFKHYPHHMNFALFVASGSEDCSILFCFRDIPINGYTWIHLHTK